MLAEHESPANNIISSNNNNNNISHHNNSRRSKSSFDDNNVAAQVTTTTSTLVKFHSNPSLSSNFSSSTTHSYYMKSPSYSSNNHHYHSNYHKGALIATHHHHQSPTISQSLSQFALNVQKGDNSNVNGGDCSAAAAAVSSSERPPFITTVTRGKFLPSKFDLMVEKSLFNLSNRPRHVNIVPSITKHQCSLSEGPLLRQSTSPRGVHDYFNMMWDPRVCRGKTSTSTTMPPIKGRIGGEPMDGEGKVGDGNATEPTIKYRKKRASHYFSSFGGGGGGGGGGEGGSNNVTLPNRYKITTRVTTKTKLPKLGLTDATTTRHLHHTHVQTEQFLEDLTSDAHHRFGASDVVIQTDPIRRNSKLSLSKTISSKECYAPMKNGVDVATQVLPGELMFSDEEIQPVAESLVGKILHQALFETMEEEELAAIKEQQNRFQEKRKHEERLLKELQEQHERITREKERLRMNLAEEVSADGITTMNNSALVTAGESNNVILDQVLRSAGLSQCGISTSYLIELLPSVLNSLRQEGFLSDSAGDDLFSSFVPMWRSSSKAEESDVGEANNTNTNNTTTARSSSGANSSTAEADLLEEEPSKLNVTTEDKEDGDEEESETKNDDDEGSRSGHNDDPSPANNNTDDIDDHEEVVEEDTSEIADQNNANNHHSCSVASGANDDEEEDDREDVINIIEGEEASSDVEMNNEEAATAAATELINIRRNTFDQPDSASSSSQLPNGRIPSFERTEGTAFQEEVV